MGLQRDYINRLLACWSLPSQHSMLGQHRSASETSFKWRFDGGPMMAPLLVVFGFSIPLSAKKTKTKPLLDLDPLWQYFLDPHMLGPIRICIYTVNSGDANGRIMLYTTLNNGIFTAGIYSFETNHFCHASTKFTCQWKPFNIWLNSIYCKIFIYICTQKSACATNFGPFGEIGEILSPQLS